MTAGALCHRAPSGAPATPGFTRFRAVPLAAHFPSLAFPDLRADSRRLGAPLVASLALHGVLAFSLVHRLLPPETPAQPPARLEATLQAAPQPQAEPPQARPQPVPARPEPQRSLRQPAPLAPPTPRPILSTPSPRPEAPAVAPPPAVPAPAPLSEAPPVRSAPPPGARGGEALQPARFDAAYLSNPKPDYPLAARRRGMEGTVRLEVAVSSEGRPTRVRVAHGSGHELLDTLAQRAVENWRFQPARRGGEPVESTVEVPVVFRLTAAGSAQD